MTNCPNLAFTSRILTLLPFYHLISTFTTTYWRHLPPDADTTTMTYLHYFCPYFLLVLLSMQVQGAARANKVIMLFIDGLRWDLVDRPDLPGFRLLFESGTRAEHLKPVFPSLCYPNFYTMMTGLYPESHGLIGNNIYDPIERDFFSSAGDPERDAADHWWQGAEPLWITAKKQKKLPYLYYWAGCEREINGDKAEYCRTGGAGGVQTHQLVESLKHGLDKMEEGKTDFVAVYYSEIDTLGHQHGPKSPQLHQKVKDLDKVLLYLQHDLWERGLNKEASIVLVSDHGMTDASIDRTINLRRLVTRTDVNSVLESGAYVSIWPKPEKLRKVYLNLKAHPRLQVYMKEEIPESWHYRDSHRVAPITALADLGWYIETHDFGYLGIGPRKTPALGMHGYHNDHPDMWGVLVAAGPDVVANKTMPGVDLVDLYQILSHLLDVNPRPHNGTWSNIQEMFHPTPQRDLDAGGMKQMADLARSENLAAYSSNLAAASSSSSSSSSVIELLLSTWSVVLVSAGFTHFRYVSQVFSWKVKIQLNL